MTKINSILTLIGISTALLIFAVIIGGYYMVNTNGKIDEFLKKWDVRQQQDNLRFNATLNALGKTYNLIIGNQHLIIESANSTLHNQQTFKQIHLNNTKKLDKIIDFLKIP